MLTRGFVNHDFNPQTPAPVNTPGAIAVRPAGLGVQGNVEAAMPIVRPNSSPSPQQGAPFYSAGNYRYPNNTLVRGGTQALTPTAPRMAMDPLDKSTWQRPYSFSTM